MASKMRIKPTASYTTSFYDNDLHNSYQLALLLFYSFSVGNQKEKKIVREKKIKYPVEKYD